MNSHPSRSPPGRRGHGLVGRVDRWRRLVDDVRVREHLRRAERELRATGHGHLAREQRRRRQRQLDALGEYRRRGEFRGTIATKGRFYW